MFSNHSFPKTGSESFRSASVSKTFLSSVFSWMFMGLGVTSISSYLFSGSQELMMMLVNPETGGLNLLGWVVMLAPFGFVLVMGIGYQRMSFSTLSLIFVLYSIIMGLSLSFIFLAYTQASIFKTFLIASGMFGFMAILGYSTKTDLTRFGSLMFMGLIGIVIASLVNLFLGSSSLDYIISFIGVLVFTGLTAYDVQKLKRIGASVEFASEEGRKVALMGALTLYLDFINMFLFLLHIFGGNRD